MRKNQRRLFLGIVFLSAASVSGLAAAQAGTQRGVSAVKTQPALAQPGTYYALVIGVADYTHLPKLRTPVNDAQAVAELLRSRYGFNTKVLPNATRDQILTALDDYRRRLSDQSSLLIYYAGHGYYDKEQDRAYWAPVDAQRDTYARWIIAEEITGAARAIPARHVLIVSDSCYSGMLTRSAAPTVTPIEHDEYIEKMQAGKSRDVMASGGNEPVADGDAPGHSLEHSVFANALLQGLTRMDLAEFSADELFNQHIREQVGGRSNQVPQYNPVRDSGHEEGDFVFLRTQVPEIHPAKVTQPLVPVTARSTGPLDAAVSAPGFGGLMITAPADAKVFFDGQPKGIVDASGSLLLTDIPVGPHTIKFQMGSFLSDDKPVNIINGGPGSLAWTPHLGSAAPISTAPQTQESPKVLSFNVSLRHGSKGTLTLGDGSIRFSPSKSKDSFVADLAAVTCDRNKDGFYLRTKEGKEYDFRAGSKTTADDICDAIRKMAVGGTQQSSASLVTPPEPK
ncbi:MAG TPA: caspase family protein [Terriglobia bacterium]|nr:caspase family protein [Terriglobia bacterium]